MLGRIVEFIRNLVAGADSASPEEYTAVVPASVAGPEPALRVAPRSAFREWSAITYDLEQATLLGRAAYERFHALPRNYQEHINEATTRTNLVDPMLAQLGWSPLNCEVVLPSGGRVDAYDNERQTAIEIKRAQPKYDDIAALNPTQPYKTVGQQVIGYLDNDNVKSVIYTNGRMWWRIERDDVTSQLYALRVDLRLASDMAVIRRGPSEVLQHFAMFFHSGAFNPGVNFAVPVHPGRWLPSEHSPMWLKDLNKGIGWSETP
ncbi:hypothetical protein [Azospirillum soli]|uniref:hypothetical protein n=1 Tax=Azospirillum soli TaxID=1304799 RepID=UPI001AE23950|nr:hypothetical protein [Azospirillum soli]MBP2315458.1 hypothetical protein [Azospirillum soli]